MHKLVGFSLSTVGHMVELSKYIMQLRHYAIRSRIFQGDAKQASSIVGAKMWQLFDTTSDTVVKY